MAVRSSRFTPNAATKASQARIDQALKNVIDDITTKDSIRLADANLLNRILTNDTIDIVLQERALLGAQQQFLKQYARSVGAAITNAEITTAKEMQKIQAQVYANLMERQFSMVRQVMGHWNTLVERELKYREASQNLVAKSFRLFVSESAAIAEAENIQGRLALLSGRLKDKAERAIYDSLEDAFIEAWDGVDIDAFPLEYRLRILQIINRLRSEKKIQIHGAGITTWEIYVDFDSIFGNYGELEKGYHFGAIEEAGSYDKIRRVKLPYHEQALKNPAVRRYQYWKAVWAEKPYTGGYADSASQNSAAAVAKRRRFYSHAVTEKNDQIAEINNRVRITHFMGAEFPKDAQKDKQALKTAMDQRTELIRQGNASLAGPIQPIDTTGQKGVTIAQRLAIWGDKAPYWLYLEEGQLQWSPQIPPRAVRFRFFTKVRRMISEMARIMFNKEFQGITIDSAGRARLAAGAKAIELPFQNINPNTPPGGLLPAILIRKQKNIGLQTKRNAKQALQVAPTFSIEPLNVDVEAFNAAIDAQEAEVRRFYLTTTKEGQTVRRKIPATVSYTDPVVRGGGSAYSEIKQGWASIQSSALKQDELTYEEAKARILGTITPPTGAIRKPASGFVGNIDMTNYKPSIRGKSPKKPKR